MTPPAGGIEASVRREFDRHLAEVLDDRHRGMIENFREFAVAVQTGKHDELRRLLTPDTEVIHYGSDPELRLKGSQTVSDFYRDAAAAVTTLDWRLEQLIVGDAGLAGFISESVETSLEFLRAANVASLDDRLGEDDGQVLVTAKVAFLRKYEGELASEYVVVPAPLAIERQTS